MQKQPSKGQFSMKNWDRIIEQIKSNDPKLEKIDLSEFKGVIKQKHLEQLKESLKDNNQLCYIKWGDFAGTGNTAKSQQEIDWKVAENLANYEHYPNDYVLSLFSSHAYADIEADKKGSPLDAKVRLAGPLVDRSSTLKDWKILKVYNHRKEYGYYGMLYANKNKAQLVLAHRGTDPLLGDLFGKGKQNALKTDIETVFKSKVGPHQAKAYEVTLDAVNTAKGEGYNFAITGHSLGGYLAELSLYYCLFEDKLDIQAKAVVFDSPGSEAMFKKFQSNIENAETEVDLSRLNLVTYLSVPNLVNVCNKHVGTVYALFPSVDNKASLDFKEKALNWLVGKETLQGLRSVLYHSLDGIIEQFDETIGKPKEYQLVLDWPYLERKTGTSLESLLPSEYKNLPRMAIMALGDTTMASIVSAFYDLLGGKLDTSQFFNLQKFLGDDYRMKSLTLEQKFFLAWKNHYRLVPVNEQRAIKDNVAGTSDWHLGKLYEYRYPGGKLPKSQAVDKFGLSRLSNISLTYRFDFKPGVWKEELITIESTTAEQVRLGMWKTITAVDSTSNYIQRLHVIVIEGREVSIASDLKGYVIDDFIGRESQLKSIEQYFKQGKKTISISGPPGVGKSSFAAQFGQISKSTGKVVRWFTNIHEGYLSLAVELGIAKDIVDPDLVRNLVNGKLVKVEREILFIFDNVEVYADIKKYVDNLPSNVKLIITARKKDLCIGCQTISLPLFDEAEAKRYLKESIEAPDEKIKLLIDEIGYLPFKLNVAISIIKGDSLMDIDDLISDLREREKDGTKHPEIEIWIGTLRSKGEAGWKLLQYLSYLNADFVPLSFLKTSGIFTLEELSQGSKALESLSFATLSYHTDHPGEKGYKLHRFLQEEARGYPDTSISAKTILITLIDKLHAEFPIVGNNPDKAWEKAKLLASSVRSIVEHLSNIVASYQSDNLAFLLTKYGVYLAEIDVNFEEALVYKLRALEVRKGVHLNEAHSDVATNLDKVGGAYYDKGDLKAALIYFKKALSMRKTLYPNKANRDVANSLNNVGLAHVENGDARNGLKYYELALEMKKTLYSNQAHSDIAQGLGNVGSAYISLYDANHRLYDAKTGLDYQEQALDMYKTLYPNQAHIAVATSLNNVGAAYEALGNVKTALKCFEQALKIQKTVYENKAHPDIAGSLNNVGAAYKANGNAITGLKYHKQALEMRRTLYLDQAHPNTALSLNNIGVIHTELGEAETGLDYLKQALDMYKTLYQNQAHANVAYSLNAVGIAYQKSGNVKTGLGYLEQSLEMRKTLYPNQAHTDVAESINNVGGAKAIESARTGLKYYEQALKMYKTIYLNKEHSSVATSLHNVGAIHIKLGNIKIGLDYLKQSLEMRKMLYRNLAHPDIAESLGSVGIAYAFGDSKTGLDYLKQSLEMKKALYHNQAHPSIAEGLTMIAVVCSTIEKSEKSLSYCKEVAKALAKLKLHQNADTYANYNDNKSEENVLHKEAPLAGEQAEPAHEEL